MNINMKNWTESIIKQDRRTIIPLIAQKGIEITHHSIDEGVKSDNIQYQSALELDKKFPAEAICLIMDLSVEAEAFGASIQYSQDEIPSVKGRLLQSCDEIINLQVPPLTANRIPIYINTAKRIAENSTKPVFAGCIGPYSLGGRLLDLSEMMMAIYLDPKKTCLLLEKCTEFLISYCQALKEAGTNGVIIAEPAAGLLSNDLCMQFSSTYIKRIVHDVQDESFSIILHNCGNTRHCTNAMIATEAAGYHFGNNIRMEEVLKECPSNSLVMGNLDPVSLLKFSTPEEVYISTQKLLKETAPYPNFVLSTGCDCPYGIPDKNIVQMYKALSDFNHIYIH